MKKWTVIAGAVMALALVVVTPITVLAQPKDTTANTDAARLKGILAIQAPRKARVDQPVTIRVIGRISRDPVEGVGVWALTKDEAKAVQEKISGLRQSAAAAAADNATIESELNLHAIKIGMTNGDGKVHYAFERAGGYLLIAWKPGYLPDYQPVVVTRRLMKIEPPLRARVAQPVTIRVTERGTGKPVEGAGVWAIPKDAIQSVKEKLSALKENRDAAAIEATVEAELDLSGFRIGKTDNNGKVEYAFRQPGGYLLVAWKPGHFPAFRPILIVQPPATSNGPASTASGLSPAATP